MMEEGQQVVFETPLDFCASLTKLVALGEELYTVPIHAQIWVNTQQSETVKDHMLVLQVDGSCEWQTPFATTTKKGDITYLPYGTEYSCKSAKSLQVCLRLKCGEWGDFVSGTDLPILDGPVPTGLFEDRAKALEIVEAKLGVGCEEALDAWHIRFMEGKQAPAEILQPIDIEDIQPIPEPESEEMSEEEKSENPEQEASEMSEEGEAEMEELADEPVIDFTHVKLASKHGAFIRKNGMMHTSSQNARTGPPEPANQQVPEYALPFLQKVIAAYPAYLELPKEASNDLLGYVRDLAELQILVVS